MQEREWRDEIAKYLPGISHMSFAGPVATIKWLFSQVHIKSQKELMDEYNKYAERKEDLDKIIAEEDAEAERIDKLDFGIYSTQFE